MTLNFPLINEYIFAPFNSFIYINENELIFTGKEHLKETIIDNLNSQKLELRGGKYFIKWSLEDSAEFKKSKGVFNPPGKENSFLMAELLNSENLSLYPIVEEINSEFPANSLNFKNIRFYFYAGGTGTCSAKVEIFHTEENNPISILVLEEISEKLNDLFKLYFEEICYTLTGQYIQQIRSNEIPHFSLEFLPKIEEVDRSSHFIPWTHRIYHVEDDSLFEMEDPGEHFKYLLTPSRKMDVEDLSIYDNRYVYFGWGHSIIFTKKQSTGYSQTDRPVSEYVRLVEIAQAKWQFLDVLGDIILFTINSFNQHYKHMKLHETEEAIDEIRNFANSTEQILAGFRGIKITFDTEKRILLDELNDRWLTEQIFENLQIRIEQIRELLDQLYQRQKEQRDEALNSIAFIFTVVGIIEVFGLIFDILNPELNLGPVENLIAIIIGTITVAILIISYLKIAQEGK